MKNFNLQTESLWFDITISQYVMFDISVRVPFIYNIKIVHMETDMVICFSENRIRCNYSTVLMNRFLFSFLFWFLNLVDE